ncbi:myocardin-related transcription factor A isoform X1 [Electrophorus electricus]|uniref:myocardin-related transcription factor A isoform X1 n=2 Tax=Electrophorus electricus TaxID=8005 RepID=UPI0015D0B248|nr:myocardin-related transcription factor A isoform X1 [Electrophorus electricus]XP_026884935.2 myocardin-related transcription factor A isoform X1 [Electrophorus electricus]XP_035381154.1 myocardin-related transcription factor A isoform X1 [Electrophorus electricus]
MESLQEYGLTSTDAVSVAGASGPYPSSKSDAVTSDLQELSLQPTPSLLLPIQERRNVLQIKLQQRRTREELVSQGIMPPLKSPAAFHEQRRSLERARTEDYLKRKIRARPDRSELVRMHILEETSAEPSLQAKQLLLKRARLADDLNDKLAQRPGPMELIQKNILSVNCSLTQAMIEEANTSCDDESSDAFSPDHSISHHSPLGITLPTSSSDSLPSTSSPAEVSPPPPPPLPVTTAPAPGQNLINGTAAPQRHTSGQVKGGKAAPERSKKQRDSKPKVRKLKYHQYIPPDQKVGKEPPTMLDSTYSKLLHQQQLFLQLQIISQQQQHCNYQAILPAPPRPPADQQAPSTNGMTSVRSTPPSQPTSTNMNGPSRHPIAVALDANLPPVPSNLDELKVAELKHELKLRGLTVSGTKNDLIERLKNFQEQNGGNAPFSTTGSTSVPADSNTSTSQSTSQQPTQSLASTTVFNQSGNSGMVVAALPLVASLGGGGAQPATQSHFSGSSPSSPGSPTPSEHSLAGISPDDQSCNGDAFGDMVSSPLTQLSLQHSSPDPSFATPPSAPPAAWPLAESGPFHLARGGVDKDRMLREKDRRIAKLTRMLQEKQQQVEALRSQLQDQQAGGGACQPHPPITIKEEPQDIPMEEVEPEQQCVVEEQVQLQNQLNLHRQTQHRRKKMYSRLQNHMFSAQPETYSPQTSQQSSSQQTFQQSSSDQTSKQTFQQSSSLQTSQKSSSQQSSFEQVSQVFVKQQSGTLPSLSLDVLKSNSSRTLVMDSNGNHFLLMLTNNNTDNQANDNPPTNMANPITLQRMESTPTKLSSQAASQIPISDVKSKPLTICKQPIKKALKPEKHVSPNHMKARYALSNVQSFLAKVDPVSTNVLMDSSSNQRKEMRVGADQHTVFSPSPFNLRSTLTSRRKKNGRTQRVDNLFDTLVQNGEISENFRPTPDPALSCLCPHTPPLSPSSSPLQLSLPSPSITETPREPLMDGSSAHGELPNCSAGSGRLEDFLESTTGKPLLGVEPGGHVTLIDELHSQLLSTPSILDHPSSPMDTYDLGLPSSHTGLELAESALNSMDWLDLGLSGTGGDGPGVVGLNGHPSTSVFSTDFLDSSDLQLHWDSCL